jgi:hypothetical protein
MKKLLIVACVALFSLTVLTAANAVIEEKALPQNYDSWKACVVEKVNDKLLKRVSLDDSMPPKNVVAEFFFVDEARQVPELLIWTENITNADFSQARMIIRFYVMDAKTQQWDLVGINIFDVHTLPTGKKVPLFAKESVFGQAFIQLHKKAGIQEKDIEMPNVTNTK